MSFPTLFIGIQVIIISYLLRNFMTSTPNGISVRLINNLRDQACDTALQIHSFDGHCRNFRQPDINSCRLGFSFSICDDYSVDATEFLKGFKVPTEAADVAEIETLNELLQTFAHFFSKGAAAEVRVPPKIFERLLERLAVSVSRHDLGGNSMQSALRAAKEGCKVELAGPTPISYTGKLPLNLNTVSIPLTKTDVHLVLEYKAGERYAGQTAPRSNRFYVNADTYNPQLYGLTDLRPQEVDIVVIGGVQLLVLDKELKGRVNQIKDFHTSMKFDHKKRVHFELADIRDKGFHELLSDILKETDSLGLNEQELMHQLQFLEGSDISDTNSRPTAQQLVDTINALLKLYRVKGYSLSRLHLHSVKLQVICSTAAWSTPVIPTARSALVATQLACNSTDIQSAEVHWEQLQFSTGEGSITLNDEHPVQTWKTEDFTCAAALVPYCVEAKRTKSLGDNISGVGLAYHSLITGA
jgi:hypothetical protein